MVQYYAYLRSWLQLRLANDERGANMVEYALLAALIAVAAVVALTALSGGINERFTDIDNRIDPTPAT